jgi:excisionase family DNA binding protein
MLHPGERGECESQITCFPVVQRCAYTQQVFEAILPKIIGGSSTDPRVREMFIHIRRAVDVLEELLKPSLAPVQQPEAQQAQPPPPPSASLENFAYTIKEVRELIAIGNASIYKEIGEGRLRAVKRGRRTMILAADLQNWVTRLACIEIA